MAGELFPELATRGLQQLIELEVAGVPGADRHQRTEAREDVLANSCGEVLSTTMSRSTTGARPGAPT
jgi:hypothetical protein